MLVVICISHPNVNLKDKQENVFGTSMAIWDEIKVCLVIYGYSFPLYSLKCLKIKEA